MSRLLNAYGTDRRLPGDQILVSETLKESERESLLRTATAINLHNSRFRDGTFIDRATRAATEVQESSKCITAADFCMLTTDRKLLIERLGCLVYGKDQAVLEEEVTTARRALESPDATDDAFFATRLAEATGDAVNAAGLVHLFENAAIDSSSARRSMVELNTREEAEAEASALSDQATPGAISQIERLYQLIELLSASTRNRGELENAARLNSGAARFAFTLRNLLQQRVGELRDDAVDLRGDMLRADRPGSVSGVSLPTKDTLANMIRGMLRNFFRSQASVPASAIGTKHRTAHEYAETLGKVRILAACEQAIIRCGLPT
jgi:hypothetical protein